MTDEELDQARADEAARIYLKQKRGTPDLATIAARLAREGWMPFDPLLFEAWEICSKDWSDGTRWPDQFRKGERDNTTPIRIALAALKRGIEIGKEKAGE